MLKSLNYLGFEVVMPSRFRSAHRHDGDASAPSDRIEFAGLRCGC